MKRRSFGKLLAAAGIATAVRKNWAAPLGKESGPTLPEVTMNGNSVELCTNSRYSFHGGYSATINNQVFANALFAAASAPLLATERTVYAATKDAVYTYKYKDGKHDLQVHQTGDLRSETAAAFEIGIATNPAGATEDAGIALHWAHLASIAFWKTKSNQSACCPKETGRQAANDKWKPSSLVHCVNCYGQSSSVTGLVKTVQAVSSDKSLPDAKTDGSMSLEDAMKNPLFGTSFAADEVTSEKLSQILWASYGVTPHKASSKQGLSVASHMMGYFLTGKVYVLSAAGVQRYHVRKTVKEEGTSDHRLESIATTDARPALQAALAKLPRNAPVYIVYCGSAIEYKQVIEAGYAGGGALLQATALGLQGHYVGYFTKEERTAIQKACGIAEAELPMLIFSTGKPAGTGTGQLHRRGSTLPVQFKADPDPFTHATVFTFAGAVGGNSELRIYNQAGQLIRTLRVNGINSTQQVLLWDGRDSAGNTVATGVYTCTLQLPGHETSMVIRKF